MRVNIPMTVLAVCAASAMVLSGCCGECEGFGDVAKMVGTGVEVMQQAQSAPGTEELRGAGCEMAMVITPEMMTQFEDVLKSMDGVNNTGDEFPKDKTIVSCTLPAGEKLACDDAAKIYIKAVKPPGEIMLTVMRQGEENALCEKSYQPDFK